MRPKANKPKSLGKAKAPATPHTGVIHLEYLDEKAKSVCVAGSFNDWHPAVTEMLKADAGRWVKDLTLPSGTYEYRFVVDGVWISDPACRSVAANPFGSYNSVITVPQVKL